jgi:hypothetical protein
LLLIVCLFAINETADDTGYVIITLDPPQELDAIRVKLLSDTEKFCAMALAVSMSAFPVGGLAPPTGAPTLAPVIPPTPALTKRPTPAPTKPHNVACQVCDNSMDCALNRRFESCPSGLCMSEVEGPLGSLVVQVKKYCATQEQCYQKWWLETSDNNACVYWPPGTEFLGEHCYFCCHEDSCNANAMVPPRNTWEEYRGGPHRKLQDASIGSEVSSVCCT